MRFPETVVSTVIGLEVELVHAFTRIRAATDDEALHDLRIAVRRLRSLLKPLGLGAAAGELDRLAAQVGRLTTPIRDLEVMAAELERCGLRPAARRRREQVAQWYRESADHAAVRELLCQLDAFPPLLREAAATKNLRRRAAQRLLREFERLSAALSDAEHDRHAIRLQVKRTRYAQEAYPLLLPLPTELAARLKRLQSSLGSWHDHQQWCLRAVQEDDLRPLVEPWRDAEYRALIAAEGDIGELAVELELFLRLRHVAEREEAAAL